jgi:spore germination cell wall hydrolase CwlJ-like protein
VHEPELQLSHDTILHGVRRGPLIGATLLLLAILMIIVFQDRLLNSVRQPKSSDLTLALAGPLPAIEPLILQAVPQEVAKKVNDATPFTKATVEPAAPFKFDGSTVDFDRAVDCLAATVFYEAGAETVAGQMAVVQVVLNRARHPAYPNTVCGVVFQGHERRTGCQFSYTCDGSMTRRPSNIAWERFRALSRAMLGGLVYAPVGTATHYHTDWVLPKWSATLDKVRAEGTHLFFRWHGAWGTRKAFRARYAGGEAAFAKLALLSTAHRTPDMNLDEIMKQIQTSNALETEVAASTTDPLAAPSIIAPLGEMPTATERAKDTFLIHVSPALEPTSLADIAEKTCGTRDYCKVFAWTNKAQMPKGAELTETSREKVAFSYLRNRSQGFEKPLWNCTIFKRADAKQCMRRRVVPAPATDDVDPPIDSPQAEKLGE